MDEQHVRGTPYEIIFTGQLEERWTHWFADLVISHPLPGQTALTGSLPDQPALYGILSRLRDLRLELVSVRRLDEE